MSVLADVALHVLVLGATGDQGRPQVELAVAKGHRVRAAARGAARASPADKLEFVRLDYAHPQSLAAAMDSVDVVLANFPSSSFNDGEALVRATQSVGRAARSANVRLIVFNASQPVADAPIGFRGHDVRLRMRQSLEQCGVPLVTLQPSVFMGNLLRWAYRAIVEQDQFIYPHRSDLEVSWICQQDLAELMLAAAERPQLAGRRFAVGGPEILRGDDVAAAISAASGRRIAFVSQPIPEFCAALAAQMKIADAEEKAFMLGELAGIYRWYNKSPERPFRVDMTGVLRQLPVQLTTLKTWATRQNWRGANQGRD
jgi:uncharacterized protein YbjT (DUF2867 family)